MSQGRPSEMLYQAGLTSCLYDDMIDILRGYCPSTDDRTYRDAFGQWPQKLVSLSAFQKIRYPTWRIVQAVNESCATDLRRVPFQDFFRLIFGVGGDLLRAWSGSYTGWRLDQAFLKRSNPGPVALLGGCFAIAPQVLLNRYQCFFKFSIADCFVHGHPEIVSCVPTGQ
jgi:hypothetical protein